MGITKQMMIEEMYKEQSQTLDYSCPLLWEWYAKHQAELCPVDGHKPLSDHTVPELVQCALNRGVIVLDDLTPDLLDDGPEEKF